MPASLSTKLLPIGFEVVDSYKGEGIGEWF
jgi:hypothetical protein